MPLKALIFDMDGVLVDSMPYHATSIKNVFDSIGVKMDKQDIYDLEGSQTIEIVRYLLEKGQPTSKTFDPEEIVLMYREEFNRISELKTFEEMPECLAILKKRFLLAVVSGSDRNIVHNIIGKMFPHTFDVVITGEDITKGKPAPDPFLKALEMLDIDKSECIVIENAVMGVESAKRAGLYCVAVPVYIDKSKLKSADLIINNHEILIKYLLDLDFSGK
ncbi:MAG: HAD family phosphatase [Methanosarcinaceae archaeon]|nr:HAD family phosphatase [Methanosarcinaceae archaeon]